VPRPKIDGPGLIALADRPEAESGIGFAPRRESLGADGAGIATILSVADQPVTAGTARGAGVAGWQ
jgi:hypothetical protein